jgi:hypothetical protein
MLTVNGTRPFVNQRLANTAGSVSMEKKHHQTIKLFPGVDDKITKPTNTREERT